MSAHTSIVSSATSSAIQSKLDAANGRRRERTVNYAEALQAIREALRDGYGYVNGGTVTNSYGYTAIQTKVTAIAGNGAVIVRIFTDRASKGSGTGLPWNRKTSKEKIASIIDASTQRPYLAQENEIRMSRNTARRIVAAQDHADAVKALKKIPAELLDCETLVSAADSLAAGNCESETRRVQSWFPGRESVPANEILQAIVERAPSLVSFAVRAIQYAQRRVAAA